MLTLNTAGKNYNDILKVLSGSGVKDENELKILIDPSQFNGVKKILEEQGFSDVILEDDEGNLYVLAKKKPESEITESVKPEEDQIEIKELTPSKPKTKSEIIKNSTGVLISGKYKDNFMKKFLMSLVASRIKPDVIAIMNSAVKIAVYDSETCAYLKTLELEGVKILISDSCSDRIGISEAVGVGTMADMTEIIEEIFMCERVINV